MSDGATLDPRDPERTRAVVVVNPPEQLRAYSSSQPAPLSGERRVPTDVATLSHVSCAPDDAGGWWAVAKVISSTCNIKISPLNNYKQ